ncbi:hypothetical protein OQI_33470 [Streptomyces pharetrae CZA14]|uniref:Uncharacterized protein n=1 Tax=Streptomyces pharetrae CZA14 TaxID=1144883 RepID=A0ABX3Y9F8_9ACTN|nr:hypothetical protein OQI_33470 [Streptomyces pharetrae CZA14]
MLERVGFLCRHARAGGGVPDGEGAFVACSLWYADGSPRPVSPAGRGTPLGRVPAVRTDAGPSAGRWDPRPPAVGGAVGPPATGRQLGNAPQVFSCIALVEAAFTLGHAAPTPR